MSVDTNRSRDVDPTTRPESPDPTTTEHTAADPAESDGTRSDGPGSDGQHGAAPRGGMFAALANRNYRVYVSGSPLIISHLRAAVKKAGGGRITTDAFLGY